MNGLILSFRAKVQHGCLVIRDAQAEGDVSDWDPSSVNWYKAGSSIIFGVLPASEGWIDCEVWSGNPVDPLPLLLFDEEISSETGWLVVHDPNDDVRMRFRGKHDRVRISALVDDLSFASKVQVAFRGADGSGS